MGTGCRDGCQTGIIPQVMNVLFSKIEILKHQAEFQLHVSFIEVHEFPLQLSLSFLYESPFRYIPFSIFADDISIVAINLRDALCNF